MTKQRESCGTCAHYNTSGAAQRDRGLCELTGRRVVSVMFQCPMWKGYVKSEPVVKREYVNTISPVEEQAGKGEGKVNAVDVGKFVSVEKDTGFAGSIRTMATPKEVVINLTVKAIPEGGGKMKLHLSWGKIYGVAKKANPVLNKRS